MSCFYAIANIWTSLQNNVCISVEKRRRITTKKNRDGTRRPVDEDDVQLAANAASAIAFRDAVFKVIPGALIRPVFDAAKKVAVGEVKSLAERRGKVVDRLRYTIMKGILIS